MTSSTTSLTLESARPEPGRVRRVLRQLVRNPLVLVGLLILLMWVVITLFAAQLAPVEPLQQSLMDRLKPPDDSFYMGTDELGRDIFSRVLYGSRITIPAGLAVVILSSILGTLIGAVSGYIGGMFDELLMRFTELFMAFPPIILALAVTAALGSDIQNAVIALVLVWWPSYARLMRSLVMEERHKEYVEAAHSLGASNIYILFRSILPNSIAPVIILMTLDIGVAILTFAGLSFLGLGAEPSSPEWGRMVSVAIDFFDQWWMWLFPGLAITSLAMAFNFIGDGLRDILDPRIQN